MSTIDKSALLAALQPITTTLEVEGFGALNLRQLTVAQTDAARASADARKTDGSPSEFGLHLLLVAVVDADGAPVFDDVDLPALRGASGTKVEKLVAKVLQINGFIREADSGN